MSRKANLAPLGFARQNQYGIAQKVELTIRREVDPYGNIAGVTDVEYITESGVIEKPYNLDVDWKQRELLDSFSQLTSSSDLLEWCSQNGLPMRDTSDSVTSSTSVQVSRLLCLSEMTRGILCLIRALKIAQIEGDMSALKDLIKLVAPDEVVSGYLAPLYLVKNTKWYQAELAAGTPAKELEWPGSLKLLRRALDKKQKAARLTESEAELLAYTEPARQNQVFELLKIRSVFSLSNSGTFGISVNERIVDQVSFPPSSKSFVKSDLLINSARFWLVSIMNNLLHSVSPALTAVFLPSPDLEPFKMSLRITCPWHAMVLELTNRIQTTYEFINWCRRCGDDISDKREDARSCDKPACRKWIERNLGKVRVKR